MQEKKKLQINVMSNLNVTILFLLSLLQTIFFTDVVNRISTACKQVSFISFPFLLLGNLMFDF